VLLTAAKFAKKAYSDDLNPNEYMISCSKSDAQVLIACQNSNSNSNSNYDKIIAWRGTSSVKDAMIDIDIRRSVPSFYPINIKVHSGFLRQYQSVRNEIIDKVKDCKKILIASHSLGAANATIMSLDLAYNYPNIDVENITFGSPRCGSRKFAKEFNKKVLKNIRCVHEYDGVSMIPIPIRFCHVNTLLKLKSKDNKNTITKWFKQFTPVSDHSIDNYIESISNL
jgi:hypothetical protein